MLNALGFANYADVTWCIVDDWTVQKLGILRSVTTWTSIPASKGVQVAFIMSSNCFQNLLFYSLKNLILEQKLLAVLADV